MHMVRVFYCTYFRILFYSILFICIFRYPNLVNRVEISEEELVRILLTICQLPLVLEE